MVFCSQIFLFLFLPICLLCYYLVNAKYRNFVLLFFSIVFYVWGETQYFWLISTSIIVNYLFGILLSKYQKNTFVLTLGVATNVAALMFYKYAFFISQNLHIESSYLKNIVLPLGISFYTFHSISYLVDIYFGKAKAQTNIIKMGLYIVNFSQLVAGPIIRYNDVAIQLTDRKHIFNRFRNGIKLFIYGLSKKMIIANSVGAFADTIFDNSFGAYSNYYTWLGVFAYTLQIYFDFSGYSDMAIGIGKLFGFEFKPNFNFPYGASSIREFWQKWHMSLSSWFRDYVYIPLGGNKQGHLKTGLNLLLVFILCGFWHGANYTFLVWGLYHGLFLILERSVKFNFINKIPTIIKQFYVIMVVMFGWVFFRSNSFDDAMSVIQKMLFLSNDVTTSPDVRSFTSVYFMLMCGLGFFIATGGLKKIVTYVLSNNLLAFRTFRLLELVLLVFLFLFSISEVVNSIYNPFIYYRF